MNMAITVSQVLRSKGHGFFAISPQATAYEPGDHGGPGRGRAPGH